MNAFKQVRRAIAKAKLAGQVYNPNTSRVFTLTLQTATGFTLSNTILYQGPASGSVLEQIFDAIETLDNQMSSAEASLQSLAVEQGVPQPESGKDVSGCDV